MVAAAGVGGGQAAVQSQLSIGCQWTNQRRVSPVLAGDAVAVAHAAPQPGPSLLEHLLRQVPQADQRVLAHAAEPAKHYILS